MYQADLAGEIPCIAWGALCTLFFRGRGIGGLVSLLPDSTSNCCPSLSKAASGAGSSAIFAVVPDCSGEQPQCRQKCIRRIPLVFLFHRLLAPPSSPPRTLQPPSEPPLVTPQPKPLRPRPFYSICFCAGGCPGRDCRACEGCGDRGRGTCFRACRGTHGRVSLPHQLWLPAQSL